VVRYRREECYSKPKSLKELLELALKREVASANFYENMMERSFSSEIKAFINELRNEEVAHQEKIRGKLKELG